MEIWAIEMSLEAINQRSAGTMVDHLGIKFIEIGADYLKATMPVDHRTKQPIGLLHGGASCVLAETIGSTAANCCVDTAKHYCVGLAINANHIRSARDNVVTGTTKPIHLGRSSQVWEILIHDVNNKLCCVSRLTMAVLTRK